jgi:hypothetical protein
MTAVDRIAVAFSEAIEFQRRRLAIGSDEWLQILAEEGVASSAIADDTFRSVAEDLAGAVLELMQSGGTLDDFRRDYDRIVKERGWAYRGDSGWHSRLVWRLNLNMAQSAGRWEQAQRLMAQHPGRRFYGRYVTAGDHKVRHTHAEWDGIILPLDHVWWLTHWTPNGFNCRCHPQIVTDLDLRRFGWAVTHDDDPRLLIPPDPGWDFNPGLAGMRLRQREAR